MKASTRVLAVAWVALEVVAAGCGGVTLQPSDGGSTAGHGGGGSAGGYSGSAGTGGSGGTQCGALDETACKTRVDCTAQYCHACPNQSQFEGCTTIGAPPMECAEECVEASCGSLDQATCKTRSDCQPEYCCSGEVYEGCGAAGAAVTCMTSCPLPCEGRDETTCMNSAGSCTPQYCPNCDGGQTFEGCAATGSGGIACGLECPAPPSCSFLDETECKSATGCTAEYCPSCTGGQTFEGCSPPNSGAIACPAACPAPAACSTVTTEAACNARTDCYSVFDDPGTCGCNAVGCCAHFSWCADGAKASCGGMPLCQVAAPHCEAPAFVVSYSGSCFEGCVRPSECGP